MFKQLLKDSALYGFADMLLKVLAFFTFPVFAHLLSVNDYGVLSLAAVIAGFVSLFINLGLNNAVQRFYFDNSLEEKQRPALVSTGYFLIAIWSIILTAVCILIAYYFRDYTQRKYDLPFSYLALALLANIPAQLLTFSNDTIRLHFKPKKFFLLALFRNLGGVVLAIILMKYFKLGLYGYFIANFLGAAVFIPIGIWLTKQDFRFIIDRKIGRMIIRFGYPFIFAGLGYWLFSSMDRWMLGEWSTVEEIGLYSIAFKIGSIVMFVNAAFGQAWSPIAIKVMNENPETYKALFSKLFNYWFALLLIIGAGTALFTTEFLRFTTPKPYWKADNATIWVTMGLVFSGTTQLTALGISISKQTKFFTYIAWVTAILNFAINYFLIPKWGALGSAIATTVTYVILSGGYLYFSQRLHPLPLEHNKILMLLFFLAVTIVLGMLFNNYEWNLYLSLGKICWIGFMALVFFRLRIIELPQLKLMFFTKRT
jgi:O-antigen/teichoic acid export membrane protein